MAMDRSGRTRWHSAVDPRADPEGERGAALFYWMASFVLVIAVMAGLIADRGLLAIDQQRVRYALQDALNQAVQQVDPEYLAHGVVIFQPQQAQAAFVQQFMTDLNLASASPGPNNTIWFYPKPGSWLAGPIRLVGWQIYENPNPLSYVLPPGVDLYNQGQPYTLSPAGTPITRPSIYAAVEVPVHPPWALQPNQVINIPLFNVGSANLASGSSLSAGTNPSIWTNLGYNDSWWTGLYGEGQYGHDPWRVADGGQGPPVPLHFPDPQAWWLTPIPAQANANPSQVGPVGPDAPDGPWYLRYHFALPTTETLQITYSADDFAAVYIDGQLVSAMTGGAGLTWTQGQTVTVTLAPGPHVLAAEVINGAFEGPGGGNLTAFILTARTPGGQVVFDTQPNAGWITSGYTTP